MPFNIPTLAASRKQDRALTMTARLQLEMPEVRAADMKKPVPSEVLLEAEE